MRRGQPKKKKKKKKKKVVRQRCSFRDMSLIARRRPTPHAARQQPLACQQQPCLTLWGLSGARTDIQGCCPSWFSFNGPRPGRRTGVLVLFLERTARPGNRRMTSVAGRYPWTWTCHSRVGNLWQPAHTKVTMSKSAPDLPDPFSLLPRVFGVCKSPDFGPVPETPDQRFGSGEAWGGCSGSDWPLRQGDRLPGTWLERKNDVNTPNQLHNPTSSRELVSKLLGSRVLSVVFAWRSLE